MGLCGGWPLPPPRPELSRVNYSPSPSTPLLCVLRQTGETNLFTFLIIIEPTLFCCCFRENQMRKHTEAACDVEQALTVASLRGSPRDASLLMSPGEGRLCPRQHMYRVLWKQLHVVSEPGSQRLSSLCLTLRSVWAKLSIMLWRQTDFGKDQRDRSGGLPAKSQHRPAGHMRGPS